MKRVFVCLLSLSFFVACLNAQSNNEKNQKMRYQAVPVNKAVLVQKGDTKNYCPICGMTLPMFYKTSHVAKSKDGMKQYCSIHCLVEDNIVNKTALSELKVVDNTSLKLIDSKSAFFVVGSTKPATMAMVSKYGFAKKEDAMKFAKEFGGEIKSFDDVYMMVSNELEKESAMIAKRQKKMQIMGEKIYNKICKKTDTKFLSTAKAKSFVRENRLCGELKGKKLQAVGIYLSRR